MSSDKQPPRGGLARSALVSFLDEYLETGVGDDYGPNGLQVEGAETVRRIVTGVSACGELFDRASETGADTILVHHGLFWKGTSRRLAGVQYRRVAALIRGGMNLLAYHLPLDRHPEVGNNALAGRGLGLEDLEPFGDFGGGPPVGFKGRLSEPLSVAGLAQRCRDLFRHDPLVFDAGPQAISTLGIVSGAADKALHQAIDQGLDAFITGEPSEWVMNVARDAGIHFLACGHHATERVGIRALGDLLAERFGLHVEFIDVPNPV